MSVELENTLSSLGGKASWANGLRAFRDGAVLDIQVNGRMAECRVANAGGRFERVQLKFKKSGLHSRCSCSWQVTPFCQHAVAALLQLTDERPEINAMLEKMAEDADATEGGGPDAPAAPAVPRDEPACSIRRESPKSVSLRTLLARAIPSAAMEIHLEGGPPTLESRWNRLGLRIDLIFDERKYSASNMKRLVEIGSGAGGMRFTDFSIQEQQLMRLILGQAETVGARYILASYDVADMLHCLTGYHALFSDSGRINVHPQSAELVFVTKQENHHFVLTPRFALPKHGLLPSGSVQTVVGRGGTWIGVGADYWWLPGMTEANWLRAFLTGDSVHVTPEDLGRLNKAATEHRLPIRLLPDQQAVELRATRGHCSPVLTLDWTTNGLVASLEFEYAGKRIDPDGPDLLWERRRFIARDSQAEAEALEKIKAIGFGRQAGKRSGFSLRDPDKLWAFLDHGFQDLNDSWQLYYSSRFTRNRQASGDVNMTIRTRDEASSWFELEFEIETPDGQLVEVDAILDAIEKKREHVTLKSGIVAGIPEALRDSLAQLLGRAEGRDGNSLRFQRAVAVPVSHFILPYSDGEMAGWRRLCHRLTEPLDREKIQVPENLETVLRGYQKEGIAWLCRLNECGFHGILADEMGLGKTVQALGFIALRKAKGEAGHGPAMVVCPTSLVENWMVEATRFAPQLKALAIHGPERQTLIEQVGDADLVITSYALLRRDIAAYRDVRLGTVILDEAQHIKNPDTVNAKTCKELQADQRLILTGTPIENALHEVWSLFDFLVPGMLGTRQQFHERYEVPAAAGDGREATAELAAQIRPFILRRTKKQVCSQLPPKMEQIYYCELEGQQRQLYADIMAAGNEMLRRAKTDGWQQSRFEILALLIRLRQACCHPPLLPADFRPADMSQMPSAKMALLQEIILQVIDGERRMLLFSQFTSLLKLVVPWLESQGIPYQYLDGSTRDRQARVDRFNADDSIPIFLISLKAGGTGLNLTGADTVIHFDQWWNPMVEDQATDRTHRIGQTNMVTSIKLVTRHTIEEKIIRLQDEKRELFNQIIGGAPSKLGELSPDDLEFLFMEPDPPIPAVS